MTARAIAGALCLAGMQAASAQAAGPDMGKLLATGGVSQVEGAGGGGLVPWALVSGYGTRDSYGGNAHLTYVRTQDYSLRTYGVAVGLADRVEFSLARQDFRGDSAALNGVGIQQDIVGIKVKVAGDAVYDQDSAMPQISVGAQYKRNNGITGLGGVTNVKQLGAAHDTGIDYYVAATKIFLDQSLLLNGTIRATKANQFGLLGFGNAANGNDSYQAMFEASAAYLINRNLVAGVEYRMKPNNLSGLGNEKGAYDVFLAYFPTKNLSVTAAWVNLGQIVGALNPQRQSGFYLSAQIGF